MVQVRVVSIGLGKMGTPLNGLQKRAVTFFVRGFFLISLGYHTRTMHPMWALNTRGEPNEIELAAAHV